VKPGPWWRAQNSCVDHAKLIKLSDKAHRNWFNLVCVASAHAGVLPDIATIAIKLRMTEARCAAAIAELVAARLFDQREDGFSFLTTGTNFNTSTMRTTQPMRAGKLNIGRRRQRR
jgi:hypothetical protein